LIKDNVPQPTTNRECPKIKFILLLQVIDGVLFGCANEGLSHIRHQGVRSKPRDYGGLIQPIKVDLQTNNARDPINLQQESFEKEVPQTSPWWRANPKGAKCPSEIVRRTAHSTTSPVQNMCVNHHGAQRLVTRQFLNRDTPCPPQTDAWRMEWSRLFESLKCQPVGTTPGAACHQ
jgi:hypothetical protein